MKSPAPVNAATTSDTMATVSWRPDSDLMAPARTQMPKAETARTMSSMRTPLTVES